MTNNKLTDEQVVTLQLRLMSALSFYRQRSEKEAKNMADLLTLCGIAASELQERRKAEAPGYPETLPCPVLLEPGLKFGKGVSTRLVLDALRRRADYYAELEGMTPEQRAKHDAGIDEFKAMLQGSQPVSNRDELPCAQVKVVADLYALCWQSGEVVTYTPDSEKALIWINNYSGTCVQEYVTLERFRSVVSGNSPVTVRR